jgi:glucan phosphoethanolaminetransferase (alkaline phosphatase superfamily)
MRLNPRLTSVGPLLLELGLWGGVSGGFLWVYIGHFGAAPEAAFPHAWLVLNYWLVALVLRMLVSKADSRLLKILGQLILVWFFVFLLAYYALTLTGLASWGRVITWALITTYAGQWTDLVEALGHSPQLLLLALATLAVAMLALVAAWPKRLQWVTPLSTQVDDKWFWIAIATLSITPTMSFFGFVMNPPAHLGEPLSLTFFPGRAVSGEKRFSAGFATTLSEQESKERENYKPNPAANRRNVIVVVSDSLRPDHMEVYGYQRATTPYLSRFAANGQLTQFYGIRGICAESACGLLGMARSKYAHQMTDNAISLQEVMKWHGYRSHMVLGGDHTNFYSLKEAYGSVDTYYDGSDARGYYMNDDRLIVDRLARMPSFDGTPAMFQLHFMSTHGLGTKLDAYAPFQPARNHYPSRTTMEPGRTVRDETTINFYDNGVLQFDALLRQSLELLSSKGYLQDALVVITSDHGEMLGEYGEIAHAKTVHEQVLQLPLLLLQFGQNVTPMTKNNIGSQVDIAPTILHELNMPIPKTWHGFPLQIQNDRNQIYFQQNKLVGLYDSSDPSHYWKYWKDMASGNEYVSDLSKGKDETPNLVDRVDPKRLTQWRQQIVRQVSAFTPQEFVNEGLLKSSITLNP